MHPALVRFPHQPKSWRAGAHRRWISDMQSRQSCWFPLLVELRRVVRMVVIDQFSQPVRIVPCIGIAAPPSAMNAGCTIFFQFVSCYLSTSTVPMLLIRWFPVDDNDAVWLKLTAKEWHGHRRYICDADMHNVLAVDFGLTNAGDLLTHTALTFWAGRGCPGEMASSHRGGSIRAQGSSRYQRGTAARPWQSTCAWCAPCNRSTGTHT